MPNSPAHIGKYEMAQDGMHFLVSCCLDDIAREKRASSPDPQRLDELRKRLDELSEVLRRLQINTDSVTLPICEKYGAQIRARLASGG